MIVSNYISIISPDNFIATSTLSNPESVASIINCTYIFPNLHWNSSLSWSSIFNSCRQYPLDTSTGASHTGQCVLKPKYPFFPINMVLLRDIIISFNDTTILTVTQIKNPGVPLFFFSTVSQKPFCHQILQFFLSIISYMAPFPFIPITAIPTLILSTSHFSHSLRLLVTRFSSLQKKKKETNRETNKTGHQINTLKPTQKSMVLHYIPSQVKTLFPKNRNYSIFQ